MKNAEYWKERSERREKLYQKESKEVYSKIEKLYKDAFKDINREARNIIQNSLGLSDTEAYIFRLEKLKQLKQNILWEFQKVANKETKLNKARYSELLPEAYNKTIYDAQTRLGLGFNFAQLPARAIDALLKDKWAGGNFSEYIWANAGKTAQKAYEIIASGLASGAGIREMTIKLADIGALNVDPGVLDITAKLKRLEAFSLYAAERIIRTETNYYSNQGELAAYKEMGLSQYQYLATLDKRTSKLCRDLDNKIFDLKDAAAGKNWPPMHPNCRSTTIAAFDDDNIADLTRRARDPETGKYVEVPADLSYNEWVKRYIPEKALRPQDDKRIIIDSGAIKRADFTRMETHAKMFYEEIRKRKTDINTIAENTDFSVEDVEKIKNHIFFNKYDLSDGYGRFYESYDQAVSWQNLILGGKRIREMDIILLRHELMEYNLMNHEGLSYNEAHKIAEEKYNYSKYVKELNLREGIK